MNIILEKKLMKVIMVLYKQSPWELDVLGILDER